MPRIATISIMAAMILDALRLKLAQMLSRHRYRHSDIMKVIRLITRMIEI